MRPRLFRYVECAMPAQVLHAVASAAIIPP
jgi:hypothetical protein